MGLLFYLTVLGAVDCHVAELLAETVIPHGRAGRWPAFDIIATPRRHSECSEAIQCEYRALLAYGGLPRRDAPRKDSISKAALLRSNDITSM